MITANGVVTRLDVAHRQHNEATERIRRVETELSAAFEQLHKATLRMKEEGVTTTVEMSAPAAAAYREWRVNNDKALEIAPESRKA